MRLAETVVAGEEKALEETQRAGLDLLLEESVVEDGRHQHAVAVLQAGKGAVEGRQRVQNLQLRGRGLHRGVGLLEKDGRVRETRDDVSGRKRSGGKRE